MFMGEEEPGASGPSPAIVLPALGTGRKYRQPYSPRNGAGLRVCSGQCEFSVLKNRTTVP